MLDTLEIETTVIIGNDWGATLAWQAALLRPERFIAVSTIGVPIMGQTPVPPTQVFPRTDDALFYVHYFQDEGVAEAEFEQNLRQTLQKIYYAASGDAGPRGNGATTPNPFGMVMRNKGFLASLPILRLSLPWLSEVDLAIFEADYSKSGFRGEPNLYRNLDRNWELQTTFSGLLLDVPAQFMIGTRDTGLAIPGMKQIIEAQKSLAPQLRDPVYSDGCGHWAPQEYPDQVSNLLANFLEGVCC
ncbi:alpha/beta fold hydrolase [Kordiimonas sp.]|uniref:alpha/beta fold hydrolase n=1 Tax=Kordiimonas sp. TaxID=1970157 RepID=UPI003A8F371F